MSFLYVNLEGMNQEQDLAIATQRPSEGGGERIPKPFDQLPRLAAETTADNPWPVSVLSQKFHTAVERWPAAWIAGQMEEPFIDPQHRVFHIYTLDGHGCNVFGTEQCAGRSVSWAFASKAASFKQGDRVVVHGKADIWVKQTRLSFIGDDIRKIGSGGGLKEQIDQLRMKLKGEGLFDADRKLPLPEFPSCIGLICAPHARAEGDVITNVRLRWPTVRFNIVHAFVQGPQCPQSIVEAIHRLDADPDVDVIIVARGGGSFEDLIGFSDEAVVRATAGCETPIVSAIGHEDDWTLIDLAADLRASTPTDAAKKVVPDVHEQWQLIGNAIDRMRMRIDARVGNEIRLVEGYANRPSLTQPLTMLEPYQRFVDDARRRMDIGLTRIVDDASLTVEKLHASLTALSPQSTLDRGYAVVQNADGHVIDDAGKVSAGDHLTLTLRKGVITATAQ